MAPRKESIKLPIKPDNNIISDEIRSFLIPIKQIKLIRIEPIKEENKPMEEQEEDEEENDDDDDNNNNKNNDINMNNQVEKKTGKK